MESSSRFIATSTLKCKYNSKFEDLTACKVLPACGNYCSCIPTKAASLSETCFNFLNSGAPYRVLFYTRGTWHNFPDPVTPILIDGFRNGKSCIKFTVGLETYLVDFLSMVVINLTTKKQRSIAWIDEGDEYFFPSVFGYNDDDTEQWSIETLGNIPAQKKVERENVSPWISRSIGENGASISLRQPTLQEFLRSKFEFLRRDSQSFLSVQNLFVSGMGPFATSENIAYILGYLPNDVTGSKRKESFEKRIKGTEEERGNANVSYAWFGASKLDAVRFLLQGFGNYGKPTRGVLGMGYYLAPEGRCFSSVKHSDANQQGMQHLILCRVILGNMEEVPSGSMQYCPSSIEFDSGVDNLSKPNCYVVWPTHAKTYILPEYIVGFELAPKVRDYLFGLRDIRYHGAITDISSLQSSSSDVEDDTKAPSAPYVPIIVLLEVIKDSVSPIAMELLTFHHEERKRNLISRDELMKKINAIVESQLLLSVLERFKRSPSEWFEDRPTKRMRQGTM